MEDNKIKHRSLCTPDIILVCPKCYGTVTYFESALECCPCGMIFPMYVGVPDFRSVNQKFTPSQQEIKIRNALLSAYDSCSFEELLEVRYSHSTRRGTELCEKQKSFELSFKQKGMNRSFQINKIMEDHKKKFRENKLFLDVGCGSGTATSWIMKGFDRGVAIDYSLVDLIVGAKFLEERGISNIKLVCADARCLPLHNELFDFVNATDVIEHIMPGPEQFMNEIKRVLKEKGGFYFNSPNRYNIFTPEPHVNVRFVGFMPRHWMNRYVQIMKGVKYTTVRLLSLNELKRITNKTFGNDFIMSGPLINLDAPVLDFKRKIIKRFPALLNLINLSLFIFTTNYQVIAFKTSD